eukprot:gene7692-9462_t
MKRISKVILDIEGTTTPISFVHDVLFPFIRSNLKPYLTSHWGTPQLNDDIAILYSLSESDHKNGSTEFPLIELESESTSRETSMDSIIKNVLAQMDRDRKSTALKRLQGHMWDQGFQKDILKGVIFPDVPQAMKKWSELNVPVYIYSSGSVEAQKLLFTYSDHGNLIQQIKGHFDTNIGGKLESNSYRSIVSAISKDDGDNGDNDNSHYLFVTDAVLEVKAAREAGLSVCLSIRPGNPPITDTTVLESYPKLNTFNDLFDIFQFGK